MEEQTEEIAEIPPHAFVACDGAHIFARGPHCAYCERPPEDDIHRVGKSAPVEVAA